MGIYLGQITKNILCSEITINRFYEHCLRMKQISYFFDYLQNIPDILNKIVES